MHAELLWSRDERGREKRIFITSPPTLKRIERSSAPRQTVTGFRSRFRFMSATCLLLGRLGAERALDPNRRIKTTSVSSTRVRNRSLLFITAFESGRGFYLWTRIRHRNVWSTIL